MGKQLYGLTALVGALLLAPAQAQSGSLDEWFACMELWGDEAICGPQPAPEPPPPPEEPPPPPPPPPEEPPPPPPEEPPPPPPPEEPPPPPPAEEPPPPPPSDEPTCRLPASSSAVAKAIICGLQSQAHRLVHRLAKKVHHHGGKGHHYGHSHRGPSPKSRH